MGQEKQFKGEDFVKIISSFEFHIIFNNEKHSEGLPRYDESDYSWHYDPNEDYWDFDININGYTLEKLIENRKNNGYKKYLESLFDEFELVRDTRSLKTYTRADCFDLLSGEITVLERFKMGFYNMDRSIWEQDEDDPEYQGNPPAFPLATHSNIKVIPSESTKYDKEDIFIQACLSDFVRVQQGIFSKTLDSLKLRKEWLDYTNDQTFSLNETLGNKLKLNHLVWGKNDTDLLELITALLEIKAINNNRFNLTRKEAIEFFSKIFDREIKDAESKLSKATDRKKDVSPFLTTLKESFDNYARKKLKK